MTKNETESKPDDYKVGYGKPPVHSRWKPGQSGNPAGEQAGQRQGPNIKTAFLRAAAARTALPNVTEGNIDLSLLEALMIELFRKGIGGDQKAAKNLLELGREHLPSDDIQDASAVQTLRVYFENGGEVKKESGSD